MKRWIALLSLVLTPYALGAGFTLQSNDIKAGKTLPMAQVYSGCAGGNQSPQLSWSGEPTGTKSFAVTVYDPDAPTGSGWWHWVMFNIPADVHSLPTDAGNLSKHLAPPGAVQSRTDFDVPGYGGACPPKGNGKHRYQYTVYALKVAKLPLDKDATAASVGFAINANKLGAARIEAFYER